MEQLQMWLGLVRYSQSLIKTNNKIKQALSLEQINGCRELLGIKKEQIKTTLEQAARTYMYERSQYSASVTAKNALQKWQQLRPLDCDINILALSQSFGQTQSKYTTQIVKHWGTLLLGYRQKIKTADPSQSQLYHKVFSEFFQNMNSLIYLLQFDQNMLMLYLKIYHTALDLNKHDKKSYSQLRYVLDRLLQMPKIHENNLEYVVFFTSKHLPHLIYHARQTEIMQMLFGKLPLDWSTNPKHSRLMNNVLYALSVQPYCHPAVIKELPSIFKYGINHTVRFRAFLAMLQLFMITPSSITEPQTVKVITQFMDNIPEQVFPRLSKLFYRADIWLESFWLRYFDFTVKNHKQLIIYHLHIIDDLLQSGRGGQKLKKEALKFRQNLKTQGIQIKNIDLRKQYQRNFGRVVQSKSSLQLHVANSMRLVCGAQVLTQYPIKYFLVDIMVGKKLVVQLNNTVHYKLVQGRMVLNLKSRFRERIITELGYLYKNIAVDDYTNSNYEKLEQIIALVQQTRKKL